MHQFAGKSPDDKIKFLFKVYDIDGIKITFEMIVQNYCFLLLSQLKIYSKCIYFIWKGDGLIQLRELEHVMRACLEENGIRFSEEQIEELTMALFDDADQSNRGAITFEALKKQLEKHEGLLENLSIRWIIFHRYALMLLITKYLFIYFNLVSIDG